MTTRRPASRPLASLLLSAALTLLVGVATVAAAEPPLVGGTLSAEGKTIHVLSGGNVPARVKLTSDLPDLTFSDDEFAIQPGETVDITFKTKRADGIVSALFTTNIPDAQEQGSAELSLRLTPGKVPPPPFDPSPWALTGLLTAAVLLLLRRFRPWQFRLTRAQA